MYVIRLERRIGSTADRPVFMWLTTMSPERWGERDQAMRFRSKGEAWRVAGTLKASGAWSIEEVEPA